MKNCSLNQYLKIKGSTHKTTLKTPLKMFFRGVCTEPDIRAIPIMIDGYKTTVLYYLAATEQDNGIKFDYHYIILYPENYYVRGSYDSSLNVPFEQYINEVVMCHIVDNYYNTVPSMAEAIIFNHS